MDSDEVTRMEIAMGLAGYAISQALMEAMRDADVLPMEQLTDVMDAALEKVERHDREHPTEVSRTARQHLEKLHKRWSPPRAASGDPS